MKYLYKFKNVLTGAEAVGYLQGSGGTAVPIEAIRDEVRRVEAGTIRFSTRFFEPIPGAVKILLRGADDKSHDDPAGFTLMALNGLRVEAVEE